MLKEALLFLIVSLAVVVITEARGRCDRNGADGCSIPGKLPFFYKKRFKAACNKHDICYYCGSARHVSRKSCDSYFLSNMKKTCNCLTPFCNRTAWVYYLAVRAGGHKYFQNQSAWFCNQSWVPSCMK
ncbi:conodipine-P2-like [Gigantopelta aegis]|uniref:conodipine-P2-like n=1 Tax=Gigantopelta aegis TaxID=1735272 RepID=UPI001B888FE7|nr:conodipine-P2-like [Gigantopelta aegis]XP_041373938.1 conodipine-P2-like [Gigantopelta aegis]